MLVRVRVRVLALLATPLSQPSHCCLPCCPAPAGASLVEIYTSMAFDGPVVVPNIKQQLAECLQRDGYESIQQAVGADVDMGKAKIHYAEPAGKAAAQQKRWFSWGR